MTKEKHAPDSTLEAVMYSLRGGTKVLERPDVRRRLFELSEKQLREALERLQKFKPELAPAWKSGELKKLITTRKNGNAG